MKYILVTGGAGFIGSHLVELLLKKRCRVIVIDNFNEYYPPEIKYQNIEEIKKTKESYELDDSFFLLYKGDIRDGEFVEKIFSKHKIDLVIHLGAMAGVRYSLENPKLYIDVNINGTVNLLEACRKFKVRKFIFASSSSLYGNNKKVPFSETDNVDRPISQYAATKKAGEVLCFTYHHLYDISVACLRLFTVYGPRQRPDLAIHKFTNMILNDQKIPFYGDGSTARDYTFIYDIIDGIDKVISWINKDDKQYEIFNLGESQFITLFEMVKTIEDALGKKALLDYLPLPAGDVKQTYADISKAKKVLGYNPKTSFKEGIKKFIEWKLK